MRLSRVLIAVAAAFSTGAFAVSPPAEEGSLQDERMQPQQKQATSPNPSESEGNAWLSSTPSDAWQASAQRESEGAQEPDLPAMRNGLQPLPTDPSTVPQQVPERTPAIGEQS